MAMNPEYKRIRFHVGPLTVGFPTRFGVITACNPNGVITDDAENVSATANLAQQLADAGRVFFQVTGCSPDLVHQEPGFGVVAESAEEVVKLGRAWRQAAVFWVEDGIVHLLPCGEGERAVVGEWNALLHVAPKSRSQAEDFQSRA